MSFPAPSMIGFSKTSPWNMNKMRIMLVKFLTQDLLLITITKLMITIEWNYGMALFFSKAAVMVKGSMSSGKTIVD